MKDHPTTSYLILYAIILILTAGVLVVFAFGASSISGQPFEWPWQVLLPQR